MISFVAGALAKAVVIGVLEYYKPGSTTKIVNVIVQAIVTVVNKVIGR